MKEYDKLVIQNREKLESMLIDVSSAMRHGHKTEKIKAINNAINSGCIDTNAYLEEAKKIFVSHRIPFQISKLYLLDDKSLRFCTVGCYNAIAQKLAINDYYYSQYNSAYTDIFQAKSKFNNETELYSDEKGNKLKVADLLSVIDYALTVASIIKPGNDDYKSVEITKTVLQGIDLALKNKPEDKPTNKMLHLAVSFISGTVRNNLNNIDDKQVVSIGAGLINLAIDFFCRK